MVNNFDVLVVAPNAKICWTTEIVESSVVASVGTERKLYIGRAENLHSLTLGKICETTKLIYMPFYSLEVCFPTYEVLSIKINES
jgi:hypothetical protein